MEYYKIYTALLIGYLTLVGSFVVAQQAQENLIPVVPAVQSANSVTINDCNLSITNAELLQKIHGQTPTTSLSANDIITAHKKTMEACKGIASKNPNQPWTTSMIENLCTLAIAKLEGNAETISDRPSFTKSKELKKLLIEYATRQEGSVPTTIATNIKKLFGPIGTMISYTSPDKCGVIDLSNNQGITTLYINMSDSIYNIITDCGASIPYSSRRLQARIGMLSSPAQTSYVFGVQQGGNQINAEIQKCETRLSQSYRNLLNEAQVASIKTQNNYNLNNNKQRFINISQQTAFQKETLSKTLGSIQNANKDTPITAQCDFK